MEINIGNIILEEELNIGNIQLDVVKENPKLEDLTIIPTIEEQIFKSKEYGYDNVTVKGIETEELNITPNTESQVKEGLFNKVTVAGDSDLLPENIKSGVNIFGVDGTGEMLDLEINDCSYLFNNNARLEDINDILKVCKATDMSYMFYKSDKLTSLDLSNFDVSKVTNMSYMLYGCTALKELDLSNFDTSDVTNMSYMFCSCSLLETLDVSHFNTNNVTTMQYMFESCKNVKELDLSNFNTSNVLYMGRLFYDVRMIQSLDLSNFDASKVINVDGMFYTNSNGDTLTDLRFMNNLGKGYTRTTSNLSIYKLAFNTRTGLTHESLMDVINKVYDLNLTYDVANGGTLYTQQLVLGSTNMSKLTAEEIAIATNKGWVVS